MGVESSRIGLVPLQETPQGSLAAPPCKDSVKKYQLWIRMRLSPHPVCALILDFLAFRTIRNKLLYFRTCLVCQFGPVWYFVIIARTDLRTHYQLFLSFWISPTSNSMVTEWWWFNDMNFYIYPSAVKNFPFSSIYICPCICIRMDSWVPTLSSELKCINIIYSDAHIVADWASGESLQTVCCEGQLLKMWLSRSVTFTTERVFMCSLEKAPWVIPLFYGIWDQLGQTHHFQACMS